LLVLLRRLGHARPLALAAAYTVLLATWLVSVPAFSSYDEGAHYLRAVGISDGHLIGAKTTYASRDIPTLNKTQLAWINRTAREVTVPAGHALNGAECQTVFRTQSAICLYSVQPLRRATRAKTYVGAYEPLPYLLPALFIRAGNGWLQGNWERGLWLARLGDALLVALFLFAAILLVWSPSASALSLLGVVVATTPMVIFLGSSLNPNGIETAAGLAFFASLLNLAREHEPRRSLAWLTATLAGIFLAMSRPTGPLWLLCYLLALAALLGPRSGFSLVRRELTRAWLLGLVLLGAVALNAAWEHATAPSPRISVSHLGPALAEGSRELPRIFSEAVGVFGALVVRLPFLSYAAWWAMTFCLLTIAALVGQRRDRLTLAAATGMTVAIPIGFYALTFQYTGFPMLGRYFLPLFGLVPLLAGEVMVRNHASLENLRINRLPLLFGIAAALVHLSAWFWASHRAAVGLYGPLWFFSRPLWAPPRGWLLWLAAAVVGSCALALSVAPEAIGRWPGKGIARNHPPDDDESI
jgi:hypothetical protein